MVMTRNPYWGNSFIDFFQTLFQRLGNLIQGQPVGELASDEIQLLVLLAISAGCSFVGNFLVLRKMAMLANSLSHTVLLGIVGAQAFWFLFLKNSTALSSVLSLPTLLTASLISALLTAWLTRLITRKARIEEGAGIGLVFTVLFALGLVCLTLFTRDSHIGIEVVMGNIDALHPDDVALTWSVAAIDVAAIFLLYRGLKITSFDLSFARTLGLPCQLIDALFILLTAATVVASFRAVGVLLVLAYLTGPALAARLIISRLKPLIGVTFLFSGVASILAVALSRHLLTVYQMAVSTAGLATLLIAILFALVSFTTVSFTRYRRRGMVSKTSFAAVKK